jgi:hypothetical protein
MCFLVSAEQPFEREKYHPKEHNMYFKTSTLAAAVIAVSAFAAHAQSSSTPSMAPTTGGAAKTETPGPDAKGATAQPTPNQTSSNPTMAPNPGGAAKTEAPGANAKTTAPAKLENPPSQSSSTPAMAPTK